MRASYKRQLRQAVKARRRRERYLRQATEHRHRVGPLESDEYLGCWIEQGADLARRRPPADVPRHRPPHARAGRWVRRADVRVNDVLIDDEGRFFLVGKVPADPARPLGVHPLGIRSAANVALPAASPPDAFYNFIYWVVEGTVRYGDGSYNNTHLSGKTYAGKGDAKRMADSAKRIAKEHGDPVVSQVHKPAADTTQSFIDEQNQIEANGGPGGNTYNKINSPGKKLRDEG